MASITPPSTSTWPASAKTLTNTPNRVSNEILGLPNPATGHVPEGSPTIEPSTAMGNSGVPDPSELDATLQEIEADEGVWPSDYRAWRALFGGFLLMFNSWGLVNAYGTYQSFYYQHLTPTTPLLSLNLVGSTECFVVLLLSNPIGRLLDAGFARYLLLSGAFVLTIGTYTLSAVVGQGNRGDGNFTLIWVTQGVIQGLGMAFFFVPSSQIATTWFVKRKSTAVGIVASGASIAGLVYPMMLKPLIAKIGFVQAARYTSILTVVTAFLAVLCAIPNPSHRTHRPKDVGLTWLNCRVWFDVDALKDPGFRYFTMAIMFLFFGFYTIFFNLEEWAADKGFGFKDKVPGAFDDVGLPDEVPEDAIRVFYLLAMMNGCSTLGRILSASLSDRIGTLNVHAGTTFICSILTIVLWTLTSSVGTTITFVVLFGIFSGAVIGLPPASMAEILGKEDPERQKKLGHWVGMMYCGSSPFALTGPVIAGYLIRKYEQDWRTVQLWSGCCLLCACLCMIVARRAVHQRDTRNRLDIEATSARSRASQWTLSVPNYEEKDD